jgi:Putative zinc-finger
MTVEFKCGDPAGLAGYLYDECDAAERAAIEAHLAACPSCVSELASLGATRTALASWTPPDATLGFRITSAQEEADGLGQETRRVLHPARWWQRPLPAWAQAAAAVLIFAIGAALGMRTAGPATGSAPVAANRATTANAPTVSPQDLDALENRLRAEMGALRAAMVSAPRQPQVPAGGDAVLQRVRTLLAESEERQQRELAVRLGQVLRDVDSQRRMDLLRIEQTFGQMEGFTRPELANQRQMINYLIQRTGAQRPQ